MDFDLKGAREAGYSDSEIASALAPHLDFDLESAKKAGYSDREIVDTLTASPKMSDYAKSFASGAVSGTGMIFQGGGELLARGVNAVAGTELRAENPFKGAIDWLEESQSPAAHREVANTQISGNLFDHNTWKFGADPSLKGLALQGMNAIGQFAPNLAIALGTAGASVPAQLTIGATVGGIQALGGALDEERQDIMGRSHEDLMAGSKLYRELIGRNVNPDVAKNAVAEAAAMGGGLGNAIPSAAEGAFENFLIGALTRGKLHIPGKGIIAKTAIGATGGAAMGGTEEALEQMGQNIGSNMAIGGNRPVTKDTLQQFVMGAIAEGAAGGGGGVVSHVFEQPEAQGPAASEQKIAASVDKISAAGSVDDAIQTALHESDVAGSIAGEGIIRGSMEGAVDRAARAVREEPAYQDLEAQKQAELGQIQQAHRESGLLPVTDEDLQPAPTEPTPETPSNPQMKAAWGKVLLARMEALKNAKGEDNAGAVRSDQGQPALEGQTESGSGTDRGGDVQQAPAAGLNTDGTALRGAGGEAAQGNRALGDEVAPAGLPAKTQQLFVQRGNQRFAVSSLEEASQKWDQFRDAGMRQGGHSADMGHGANIVDQDGKEVGRISWNGKVWPPGEWHAGMKPLVGKTFEEIQADRARTIDAEAHAAAPSPKNALPEPSQAQKEAGNYKKGHINVGGLDISVENPEGSKRSGVDKGGKPWSVTMAHHYGYVKGTIGFDKDHVDVFVKPSTGEDWHGMVYVVNQNKVGSSAFDEHKAMIGYGSEAEAREAYLANYEKGFEKNIDSITAMPLEYFKAWSANKTHQGPKGGVVKPVTILGKRVESHTRKVLEMSAKSAKTRAQREIAAAELERRDSEAAARPMSDAEKARRETLSKKAQAKKQIDVDRDSIIPAVIKLGGINPSERLDVIGDDKGNRGVMGVGYLFTKTGTGTDDMATKLGQYGYLTKAELADIDGGVQALKDKIRDEFDGRRAHWSVDGNAAEREEAAKAAAEDERDAQAAQTAAAEMGADLDLAITAEDLEGDPVTPENIAKDELLARAAAVDPDGYETLTRQHAEASDDEFMAAVVSFLKEKEHADQRPNEASGGAVQEAGEAARVSGSDIASPSGQGASQARQVAPAAERGGEVSSLEEKFGSDEALGVVFPPESEDKPSHFADGSDAVICTNNAIQVVRALGKRAQIWGFSEDENPTARVVTELQTGHDFALVDGRYLVDPWMKLVEQKLDRAVYDLEDQADAKIVAEWYGPRDKWTRLEEAEGIAQREYDERGKLKDLTPASEQALIKREERADERPALELSTQTESELKAKEEAAAAAEKKKADEEAAAEAKRKADAERGSFALTGSERAADENPNQSGLFGGAVAAIRAAADALEKATMPQEATAPAKKPAAPAQAEAPVGALGAHDAMMDRLRDGQLSTEEFKASFDQAVANKEQIFAELGKLTKDQLNRRMSGFRSSSDPKGRLVRMAYSDLLQDFVLGRTFSYTMGQNPDDVIRGMVAKTTEADLADYAERVKKSREEREQHRKDVLASVEDPKTLEDFQRLLSVKKQSDLTPEQLRRFDDLMAARGRERRSRIEQNKSRVETASQAVGAKIIETKHTKKGHELFVVQLEQRVEREDYTRLNSAAKRLGGYYSSFRGAGAVPGFQFTTRENADAFQKLAGGDAKAATEAVQERRATNRAQKKNAAAERLADMADRMEESAQERLSSERLTNTARRARMADSAEAQARTDERLAKTLRAISDAIEEGQAMNLDGIRNRKQVEELESILRQAKYEAIRTEGKNFEQEKDRAPRESDVAQAKYPRYSGSRSDFAALARRVIEIPGAKMVGERLLKGTDDSKDYAKDVGGDLTLLNKVMLGKRPASGEGVSEAALFTTKGEAEAAVRRSGMRNSAMVVGLTGKLLKGKYAVVLGPAEAKGRGLWQPKEDPKLNIEPGVMEEILDKVAAHNEGKPYSQQVTPGYYFDHVRESRKRLQGMGIENLPELRAALREYVGLRSGERERNKVKDLERALAGRGEVGVDFFPTPAPLAARMAEALELKPGMTVLEPSAGKGNLADAVREEEPGAQIDTVEQSPTLREILEAKGYPLVGSDFTSFEPEEKYDRIIMNPPFSKGMDAEHVQRAYEMLKPGGRLVAITGEGIFFRDDAKAKAFREWFDQVGGTSEEMEDAFTDRREVRTTSVRSRLLTIDKPGDDKAAFSRAPTYEHDVDGPVLVGNGVAIAQPAKWETRGTMEMYEHMIVVDGKDVGRITLGWEGDKVVFLPDIRLFGGGENNYRGKGTGEKVLRTILEHNGPDAEPLTIGYITHSAEPFWRKMGVRIYDTGEGNDGAVDLKAYLSARPGKSGSDAQFRRPGPGTAAALGQDREAAQSDRGGAQSRQVGSDAAAVRAAVAPIIERWGNAPEVTIIGSMDEAPASVRAEDEGQRSQGASGAPEAFIYRNRVYLVAEGISSPAAAVRALLHESVGHFGLRNVFGEALDPILDDVAKSLAGRVRTKATEYGLDVNDVEQRRMAAEEVLAEMAQTMPRSSLVQRLVAAIRQFLRELGLKLNLSENDIINQFILPARAFVERGAGTAARGSPQLAFGRDQTASEAFRKWFGKSKVVDENGKPLVVYHGTGTKFTAFDMKKSVDGAHFFTADDSHASSFGQNVGAYYVSIQNPLEISQEDLEAAWDKEHPDGEQDDRSFLPRDFVGQFVKQAKKAGNDGLIIRKMGDRDVQVDMFLPFKPGQIKSAENNRGTFNARNPDVRMQRERPWYYSALQKSVEGLKQGSAPAPQWKATLKAMKGVSQDELEWSGVNEWLDMQQGKVTKEALLDYLAQNGVKVEETVLEETEGARTSEIDKLKVELDALGYTIEDDPMQEVFGVMRRSDETLFSDSAAVDGDATPIDQLPENVREKVRRYGYLAELREDPHADLGGNTTKYGDYTLPGGENYRELLLTLPLEAKRGDGTLVTFPTSDATDDFLNDVSAEGFEDLDYGARDEERRAVEFPGGVPQQFHDIIARYGGAVSGGIENSPAKFVSTHWSKPNILAHVRFNERTDANGKKVLFLEEIQSDWAQKGKRQGFKVEAMPLTRDNLATVLKENGFNDTTDDFGHLVDNVYSQAENGPDALQDSLSVDLGLTDDQAQRIADAFRGKGLTTGVPPAPFVQKTDAWVGLALKRMIKWAADNGFDRVAWANGEQQVSRYDLSQRVERVVASRSQGKIDGQDAFELTVYAKDKHPGRPFIEKVVTAKELPDYVGKDLADRIVRETTEEKETEYKGLDLKIGGEGMRAFYDKIIPSVANKLLAKIGGGRVGTVDLRQPRFKVNGSGTDWAYEDDGGAGESGFKTREAAQAAADKDNANDRTMPVEQPGFEITPAMKEAAGAGMALFSRSGRRPLKVLKTLPPYQWTREEWQRWASNVFGAHLTTGSDSRAAKSALERRESIMNDGLRSGWWQSAPSADGRMGWPYGQTWDKLQEGDVLYLLRSEDAVFKGTRPGVWKAGSKPVLAIDKRDGEDFFSAMQRAGAESAGGEETVRFSRAPAIAGSKTTGDDLDSFASQATSFVKDYLTGFDKLSWWTKSIGTPYHLALSNKEFAPAYFENQAFMNDVSKYANEAADLAPDLLPKVEGFRDFAKKSPETPDVKSASDALYAGTLFGGGSPLEGRIWSDEELKSGRAIDGKVSVKAFTPLTDKQAALYRQALASTHKSLDELGKSIVQRLVRPMEMGFDRAMSLEDVASILATSIDDRVDELGAELEHLTDEDRIKQEAADIAEMNDTGRPGAGARAAAQYKREQEAAAEKVHQQIAELEDLKKKIADVAAKTKALQDHGYFPAMRFGQYALHVVDKDGAQLYFGMYDTKAEAVIASRTLAKEFPGATIQKGMVSKEQYRLFQGLSLDALETFADYVTGEDGQPLSKDPLVQGFLKAAVSERSVLKRHLHRKGLAGYSQDLPRVLASFTTSAARAVSSGYHSSEMLRLANGIKSGDIKDYAIKLVRYLMDPQEEAQALRGFLFAQYLGGSIASGLVNMTQPFMLTVPHLSQFTSAADAAAKVGQAAAENPDKLTGDIKAAYERAKHEGVVSPQEIHQLRAETQGGVVGRSLALRKLSFAWGSLFSIAEQFNRKTTFLAAYRIAKNNGVKDPYQFAANTVAETQFTYNKGNRPAWFRGPVGATIGTFKTFTVSYLELAKRLYAKDKKAFALLVLILLAGAGLEGLPFAEDIEDIVDTVGQWMGYATNSKKKLRQWATAVLGPTMADIALHGMSGIPGMPVDIAGRIGMANLIPGTSMLKPSEKNKGKDLVQLLGPAGQFVPTDDTTMGKAIDRVLASDMYGVLKSGVLSRAVANAAQGGEMLSTGRARTLQGKNVAETSAGDAIAKMIGLQPTSLSKQYERMSEVMQDIDIQKAAESRIAELWARGIADKRPEEVREAIKRLHDWNHDNPEAKIRISTSQIRQRVKAMQMTQEQRVVKSAPPEIRGSVRDQLRR